VQAMQHGGQIELAPLFGVHARWRKRVYEAIWQRIRQFWREEKWIRITDDEENPRFVGLNVPVTLAEQRAMEGLGIGLKQLREEYGPELQQIYQQEPGMRQVVNLDNELGSLDVDILVEEIPDVVNMQGEQFELLVRMYEANPQGISWETVVEASTLRDKDKILGKTLTKEQKAAQQKQQQEIEIAKQITLREKVAEISETEAKAEKLKEEAIAQRIENALVQADIGTILEGQAAEVLEKQGKAMDAVNKAIQTDVETQMLGEDPDPQTISVT
jgi:hypothetical protein